MSLIDVVRALVDAVTLSSADRQALHDQLDAEAGAGSGATPAGPSSVDAAPTSTDEQPVNPSPAPQAQPAEAPTPQGNPPQEGYPIG